MEYLLSLQSAVSSSQKRSSSNIGMEGRGIKTVRPINLITTVQGPGSDYISMDP